MKSSQFLKSVASSARLASILTLTTSAVLATGCALKDNHSADKPIVLNQSQKVLDSNKPSALAPAGVVTALITAPDATPSPAPSTTSSIAVTLTLDKSRILGRDFVYSLDLQYSSQFDESMNLYTQSQVGGEVPVIFRIEGNELQLVTDNKLKFPSDNNHPEDLISRFKILAQTDTTLTVSGMDSSDYLADQFGPVDDNSKVITIADHWIRSFSFDPNGNYLLQETSIKMGDGKTIGEFAESVYPRENQAPGPAFQKFEMDPTDPVGASDGIIARFRMLPSDPIITHDLNGEKKLAYAEHFDLSPKADGTPATIDWYVTPNIPDQYLPPVKLAVEGWNRYFNKMKGINRPVMRFMGRLPQGIHIGDPRYNVINWDSRLIAGAAYESQAADPETGKQSHSLIYMPAAWLKIGSDYWKKGIGSNEMPDTDPLSTPAKPKLRVSANTQCARDVSSAGRIMASGRLTEDEVKKFGVELLKQTLFHEVGHALGFAHNFEGSLSYDPSKADSMFSTSIMDYNDYELERAAFSGVDTADGPLLEYDRQELSALYNGGADIADSDPVLPACNDAEADNEAGGVNPLCIRYDVDHDPTQSIVVATQRVENATVDARDISLSQAIARVPDLILTDAKIQGVHSKDDLVGLATQYASTLKGSLDFYMISDVAALVRTVRTNVKSLYQFGDDLPDGYDADAMRERVFAGVLKVLSTTDLPTNPKAAINAALQIGQTRLAASPYIQGLAAADRSAIGDALNKALGAVIQDFLSNQATGLPSARAKVLASLARHPAVDFYLGSITTSGGGQETTVTTDYEKNVTGLLATTVANKSATAIERVAAASALATFKGRLTGNDAIAAIKQGLLEERITASTNDARKAIETIVAKLGLN